MTTPPATDNNRPRRRPVTRPLAALACAALLPVTASADPYQVELLVFARPADQAALPESPGYRPDCLARAQFVEGAATVPSAQHHLVAEAQGIQRRGSGMSLLAHTAWQQELSANSPGPWIRVGTGRELEGCMRAWLTPVPEIEIELAYEAATGERFGLYATTPLRPADVHYVDHPVLGVLVRVDPLTGGAPLAAEAPAAAAPREQDAAPAKPAAPPDRLPPPPKKPFRW